MMEWASTFKSSRRMVLLCVLLGLLLDNMLLTSVVPIMPEYLHDLERHEGQINKTTSEVSLLGNFTKMPIHVGSEYAALDSRVGWFLASRSLVQFLVNPFIGPLTNKCGYTLPLVVGTFIVLNSSLLFSLGTSYIVIIIARATQGLGSSCIAIAGMSLLAKTYPDDDERSRAMGIALGGLSLGVIVGYPFGAIMYEFYGKTTTFLIIAALAVSIGALQIWALSLEVVPPANVSSTPLTTLLRDHYILIAAGALMFAEMSLAIMESTIPVWLMENFHPPDWMLGVVFLPDSCGYFLGCNIFGYAAHKMGRWLCTILGMLIMGTCLICIPLASKIEHLIAPHFGVGIALGMVDAAVMPLLAYLVDTRHVATYGSVYAIAQVAMSMAFAAGPVFGGQLADIAGFPWVIRGIAIVTILYSPLCLFLKTNDKGKKEDEEKAITNGTSGQNLYTMDAGEEDEEEPASFSYRRFR